MSLEVRVYTIDEDGQRRIVRGLDLMKIQKLWLAQEVSSEEITLRSRQLLAENQYGSVRLYRSVSFESIKEHIHYRKPMEA